MIVAPTTHTRTSLMGILITATVFVGVFLLLPAGSVDAQQSENEARRAQLERDLALIEGQIAEQEYILNQKKQENQSLERDISILNAEIRRSELAIQARTMAIQRLSGEMQTRERIVEALSDKMDREKDSLARLLRKKNELDSFSLIEIMLASDNLSDFFSDMDSMDSIKAALNQSFNNIRETQGIALAEKQQMAIKQEEEASLQVLQRLEKQVVEERKTERQEVLTVSKGEEALYAQTLAQKQRQAAEIRSALFALRDAGAIPFGQAYEFAKLVHQRTGVRPAFLLSIITQESNLGQNVGTCNRPGDTRTWREIMPGPNDNSWRDDQTTFVQLMAELGKSPDGTPLSCPFGGGWGGAMGPAQFIPTTWNSYKTRIASAVGVRVADPWNPQHAFMASGIYLSDLGASAGTYEAERHAALRYYAGSNWNNPSNAFYGNQVMDRAQRIQADINILESSN